MDFARRQLEKYGWSNGKGLGKHEDGMPEALKPKLKRSVTGVGHDPAAEFNEHWWSALYDKAAKNVEVQEKNGKTKKIKTVDSADFTITNSTWRINKKQKNNKDNEYSEYFIRKAVLTNDGTKVENVTESESENDETEKKDVFKMTDEELFKACEGRTAHKGARHGLKALGKLARIEQQEQMLLTQSRFEGYSHAKKLKQKNEEIIEDTSLTDKLEEKPKNKKKKKKKKRCTNNEKETNIVSDQGGSEFAKNLKSKNDDRNTSVINEADSGRKTNKSENETKVDTIDSAKKSKKKRKVEETEAKLNELNYNEFAEETTDDVSKKKKKRRVNN